MYVCLLGGEGGGVTFICIYRVGKGGGMARGVDIFIIFVIFLFSFLNNKQNETKG